MHRNPSHLGSNDSPPYLAGSGIPLTDFASIGNTGGMTGRSTGLTLVRAGTAQMCRNDRSRRPKPVLTLQMRNSSSRELRAYPSVVYPRLVCRQGPPDFESG